MPLTVSTVMLILLTEKPSEQTMEMHQAKWASLKDRTDYELRADNINNAIPSDTFLDAKRKSFFHRNSALVNTCFINI